MHIKSIVAGAAIALAAATGSASAGDEFTTLGGVSAESLSSVEMAAVVGAHLIIGVRLQSGTMLITVQGTETHAPLTGLARFGSPSFNGVVFDAAHGPDCPPNCGGGF